MSISSKYATAKSSPANMVSIICWNKLGATFNLKGSLFKLYNFLYVLIAKYLVHCSSTFTFKYASDESIFVKIFLPFNLENISSGAGSG